MRPKRDCSSRHDSYGPSQVARSAFTGCLQCVHRQRNTTPKDRTMNAAYTASLSARFAAFAAAVLTSAVVLGSTMAGMQPDEDTSAPVVALERVTVTATRTN